jgi:hypothetical protein
MIIKLPTFEEAGNRCEAQTHTPLDFLIYNYTPEGDVEEECWRQDLAAALNEVAANAAASGMAGSTGDRYEP